MPEDQKGDHSPSGDPLSPESNPGQTQDAIKEQTVDNSSTYNYYDESHTYDSANQPGAVPLASVALTPAATPPLPPPPPKPPKEEPKEVDSMQWNDQATELKIPDAQVTEISSVVSFYSL